MFVDKPERLVAKVEPPARTFSLLADLDALNEWAVVSRTNVHDSKTINCGIFAANGQF